MNKEINKYKHIIWDWNGTLLDDVWLVVEIMNGMLSARNLELLDIERYRKIFEFPVINYYKLLGFDFEREGFKELAYEFINKYNSRCTECNLFSGVKNSLSIINDRNITQSIISASNEKSLKNTVKDFKIENNFERVMGLNNNYAESKIDIGKAWVEERKLAKNDVLLIGDTIHDYEVAKSIGCDHLIIANGHQSLKKLKKEGLHIIDDISSLEVSYM